MPPEAFDCGGSYPPLFGLVMEKRSNPSSRKTKLPLKAVKQELQQSRAWGARYLVVTSIGGSISFSGLNEGALLSACDHSPLWFTRGLFCQGAANFPNQSGILSRLKIQKR
jgi:hypothetical protein